MVQEEAILGQADLGEPLLPDELFLGSAVWGAAESAPDEDGVIRRIPDSTKFISLARRAAERLGPSPLPTVHRGWIRYYGPAGAIPTVSYRDALNPSALPVLRLYSTNWFCSPRITRSSPLSTIEE